MRGHMRQKSDSRRRCILEAATSLFREVGFKGASMAQISERVGGSKATLYSYFSSKEELFATAMMDAVEEQGQALISMLDASDPDVHNVLLRFGERYVDFITTSNPLACTRIAIAEGSTNTKLSASLYRLGPKRGLEEIGSYIAKVMERGYLPKGDSHIAALHLKSMLEAGVFYPLLYGAEQELDNKTAAKSAVEAFLRAYG